MDKLESAAEIAVRTNYSGLYCEPYEMLMMAGSLKGGMNIQFSHLSLLLPVALVTSFTALFRILLKPLGQVTFVSQMLAGIVLGPSCLGQKLSQKLYPPRSVTVLNVLEGIGLVYTMFVLSVRIEVGAITKAGRLAIITGLGTFFFTVIAASSASIFIKRAIDLDATAYSSFPVAASLESNVSFHVILSILTDLKLLNSELGRLALSSAMVSSLTGTIVLVAALRLNQSTSSPVKHANSVMLLNTIFFFIVIFVIVFVCRPIMVWMMKQTPDGKPLKQAHLVVINLMVLGSALIGEVVGQHFLLGPAILGFVTPTSPPLGSSLAEKIEYFNMAVFIPCYLANVGRLTDLSLIQRNSFVAVGWLILTTVLARSIAVVIPSMMYYRLPVQDALSLSLILNCRGIIDTLAYTHSYRMQLLTEETLGILLITATMRSAMATPLISAIYDSSRRYVAYRRRTIQHSRQQYELRILACIDESGSVPTIVNLLDASNHPKRTVGLHVMKLEELTEGTLPQLIVHRMDNSSPLPNKPNKADPMINAFRHYEQQKNGRTHVQCFTVVAPYATIHNDICLMAFERSTSLVIIPILRPKCPFVKTVVRNVLQMAPCSVGILFDRGLFMDPRSIFSRRLIINTCVIFVGGQDDREALAYGACMAENDTTTMLQIIRLVSMNYMPPDLPEEHRDLSMLNEFRMNTKESRNVEYVERNVSEGSETAKLLNCIGDEFDLILTGRRHDSNSPVLIGLSAWSEIQELGVIGDLLASSDYNGNTTILVLQQQASVVREMMGSPRYAAKEIH